MFLKTALISASAFAAAGTALAATAVGLVDDRTLVVIDTTDASMTASFELAGTGRLFGIDWRPADGGLYAVTDAGEILRIDLDAGAAEVVATTDTILPVSGPVAMDFNPAADRLRLMSGVVNHRIHPDTGETTVDGDLYFAAGTGLAGQAPDIVATAYLNAFGKPEATAQYNIDATRNALMRQTAPNDGTIAPVGDLAIPAAQSYALDIATDADGTNTAWLVADGTLHTVSLEDGSVTASWPLPEAAAGIRDFTVMSDM